VSTLWRCPACGQTFVTRNMPHSCQVVPLETHFEGRPKLRAVFEAFVAAARENGPVTINATKSRITLQARMRFAGVEPRRDHLRAHLVLTRPIDAERLAIEHLPPRYYLHRLQLERPEDVDGELRAWLAEAYQVGEQRHLTRSPAPAVPPAPDRPTPESR
jgi:uncharacterized protein DUF5655